MPYSTAWGSTSLAAPTIVLPTEGKDSASLTISPLRATSLLDSGEISKAIVIDLDVHQGNGTAKLFEHDSRVFTMSIHGERNYPLRKENSDLDVGLPDKTEDHAYLGKLSETLPGLLDSVKPDIAFYLSGVDVLAVDKLGRLSLTVDGARQRDRLVFEACARRGLPVAVSMGGGYAERLATIVDAHANTFREAARAFS